MGLQYTVSRGDNLSLLARQHRLPNWQAIYNHPRNADFRRRRPNPDLIMPGDQLFIPTPAEVSGQPARNPMAINYTVPGLFVPVRQPSTMACWAAMFTMMYSWKNQVSISIENAVETLGEPYISVYRNNTGLPIEANRRLAETAGMRAEPLYNPSITGWLQLLKTHGLLWTSYGWQVFGPDGFTETRAGRHIVIFYGMYGDGTANGTHIRYVDPSDGNRHVMTFEQMVRGHETGFAMRRLDDPQLGQFSQIMHY